MLLKRRDLAARPRLAHVTLVLLKPCCAAPPRPGHAELQPPGPRSSQNPTGSGHAATTGPRGAAAVKPKLHLALCAAATRGRSTTDSFREASACSILMEVLHNELVQRRGCKRPGLNYRHHANFTTSRSCRPAAVLGLHGDQVADSASRGRSSPILGKNIYTCLTRP